MQKRQLFLGDEAVAQAALDAGLSGVYAYPGTPSTEITEHIQRAPEAAERGVHRDWSANEKTALEEALGMSYCGRRAMACMKHVGLNVAADPFMNAAITGAQGGLLVVVADDPSMHSSQNEQDSRFYARFAMIPAFEPSGHQEAYDMVFDAFDLSEALRLPVLLRVTTRLAHARSAVTRREPQPPRELTLPEDHRQFTLLPANARRNYDALVAKQADLTALAECSPYNLFHEGTDRSLGILACGLGAAYVHDLFPEGCPHPFLSVGQYPLPFDLIRRLGASCDALLVVEEGGPFVEEQLRGVWPSKRPVRGRLDGALPRTGELSPEAVGGALGLAPPPGRRSPDLVRPRPPQLCRGCGHIDSYAFLNAALAEFPGGRVFSDIGCYTLGALPPFKAIHTCVDMGASITMAKGAADAGLYPSLAVIGDSTFTHSGLTGLLDAVVENSPITVLILDNDTTAMTGQQDSLASGRLEQMVLGLGVAREHCHVLVPLRKHHEENTAVLRGEIAHRGISVIISRRACIQLKRQV